MEMCYNGALMMPSSYAMMDEEEMMYVDGGWSGSVFAANLKGAYNNYKTAKKALLAGGLTLGAIAKTASSTVTAIYMSYGAAITGTAAAIGGFVVGLIVGVGISAGVTYLGNNRVWY